VATLCAGGDHQLRAQRAAQRHRAGGGGAREGARGGGARADGHGGGELHDGGVRREDGGGHRGDAVAGAQVRLGDVVRVHVRPGKGGARPHVSCSCLLRNTSV
jgi:hypothetical protein